MNSDARQRLFRSVPYNRTSWFDLFDQNGLMTKWLSSEDDEKFWYAVELMTQPAIIKDRGAAVARLLQERFKNDPGNEKAQRIYRAIFSHTDFLLTEDLFQLFLSQFRKGLFDGDGGLWWRQFQDLADISSKRALELLKEFLDRRMKLASEGKEPDPFNFKEDAGLPSNLIHRLSQLAPADLVDVLLPLVTNLIKENQIVESGDLSRNKIWPIITQNLHSDFKFQLLEGLREAMCQVAISDPDKLRKLTDGLELMSDRTITYLLLSAWAANGAYFSDPIIEYLLQNPNRLNLGLDTWGTGNGIAAVSRAAVEAAAPTATVEKLAQLEALILSFHPPEEKKRPERFGLLEFLLLHSLGESRLSDAGRRRYQEVSRKFGEVISTAPPARAFRGGFVSSPIPESAPKRMSDRNWLEAMQTYESEDPEIRSRNDVLTGGAVEVSRQLVREAEHDKERFAALALEMGSDIKPIYHDAILRALVAKHEEQAGPPKGKPVELPELSDDKLFAVFRHVHALEGHPCGRWLCHAISQVADRRLPDDILEMVSFYCINDADPAAATESQQYFGGDLVQYGINTTRGAAVYAIADLLQAEGGRWPKLQLAVVSATDDAAPSVRACSISCVLALLRIDEDLALDLYLKLVSSDQALQGSMFSQEFLRICAYKHYPKLRDVLLAMLGSRNPQHAQTASSCIAAASFEQPKAQNDLRLVVSGDEASRTGLAEFAAHQIVGRDPLTLKAARAWLISLFNDEARHVRDIASMCFHHLKPEHISEESEIIGAFIDSKAFEEHAFSLIHAIEGSVSRLPDVVLKLPMKAVVLHESDKEGKARHSRWWTNDLAKLVLRLYEQTRDESTRTQCLDVLDKMIELNFGNFSQELEKVDRSQKK